MALARQIETTSAVGWRRPPAVSLRRLHKMLILLGNSRYRRALCHGVAAAIEHRHLVELQARTVIDAGAHHGQFALLALELFPAAGILAFEPLREPRRRFLAALQGEPRVRLYPMALGSRAGEERMLVAARDDCSSLRHATAAQLEMAERSQPVASEAVRVVALDEVLARQALIPPVLLKIDVQGYELEVLQGADGVLGQIDAVYVEASFRELYAGQALISDVIDLLRARGFVLEGVYNVACDRAGRALQADFDFRRPWHR